MSSKEDITKFWHKSLSSENHVIGFEQKLLLLQNSNSIKMCQAFFILQSINSNLAYALN